jgi:hypothetical protein
MAEDHWEDILIPCKFGGVVLDLLEIHVEGGRTLDIAEGPNISGALSVRDRGATPRVVHCRVLFFPARFDATSESYFARYQQFVDLKDSGEAQIFVHPFKGQWQAKVGEFNESASAEPRNTIAIDCTFVEDQDVQRSFTPGAGVPEVAGIEEVQANAAALDATVADLQTTTRGVPSNTLGADSVSAVTNWPGKATRDIDLELVSLSSRIDGAVATYACATDIKRYRLYRDLLNLRHSLRRAAIVMQQRTPRVIEITTRKPIAARVLMARLYGGRQAEARLAEFRSLNVVENPARLPAGIWKAQAASASSSAGLRSPR